MAFKKWIFSRRVLRWGALLLSLVALAWLAAWLGQRSLRTPARKRAVQSWLDDTLNADVSILGDMVVRLNLVRDSRLVLHTVEIEHPNPTFPGKFARIGRLGAWVPPWSAAGLVAGNAAFLAEDAHFEIEQAPTGEWSHDGLMQPLAAGDSALPFPLPKIGGWTADLPRARLDLRRRGYALGLAADARVTGSAERDRVSLRAESVPFTFGLAGADARKSGSAGDLDLGLLPGAERGSLPALVPGFCSTNVRSLPLATLPFFATGIPMQDAPGVFNGLIRYDRHEQAAGSLFIEGELADAPLTVFGLPRTAPLRLNWPVLPKAGEKLQADIRMGPSGFGAFTMTIPLGEGGGPEALSMRGDVAVLDAVPGFFLNHSEWPDWLSRTFPRIEWRSGQWRGFGWEGENFSLSLSRATAGMNLAGEAEMMGGNIRLAMQAGAGDAPITLAAENLDAVRFAERLSRMLPAPFRARLRGGTVSLTWRGFPGGTVPEWGGGMVWGNPVVEIEESGTWWRSMARVAEAVALALPDWGGGDDAELRALAQRREMELNQLSLVVEKRANGTMAVEVRAFGGAFGQATGMVELREDGAIEGELLLSGDSALLAAAGRANPELANVLAFLANGAQGLRVAFRHDAERGGEFVFPFLRDAQELRETMNLRREGAP